MFQGVRCFVFGAQVGDRLYSGGFDQSEVLLFVPELFEPQLLLVLVEFGPLLPLPVSFLLHFRPFGMLFLELLLLGLGDLFPLGLDCFTMSEREKAYPIFNVLVVLIYLLRELVNHNLIIRRHKVHFLVQFCMHFEGRVLEHLDPIILQVLSLIHDFVDVGLLLLFTFVVDLVCDVFQILLFVVVGEHDFFAGRRHVVEEVLQERKRQPWRAHVHRR